ncbi:hypothetical protein V3481_015334 [Fusarium oxysporum f. sp. vasinfectum]
MMVSWMGGSGQEERSSSALLVPYRLIIDSLINSEETGLKIIQMHHCLETREQATKQASIIDGAKPMRPPRDNEPHIDCFTDNWLRFLIRIDVLEGQSSSYKRNQSENHPLQFVTPPNPPRPAI